MISNTAVVRTKTIGTGVQIMDFAVIHDDVVLGDGVIVHPHVVITSGVTIGAGTEIFPGAVIGKEPKGAGATARSPVFERRVDIGRCCSIGPHAVIFYDVVIGEGTLLGDGASVREKCRIGAACIISRYVTINYNTLVGDRSKVMDMTHVTGNCRIGRDVFISTMVATTNDNRLGRAGYVEGETLGPTVEDGAMVGAGAVLLPGIVVGRNAIVGAGAVVTKNVEAHTVAMGVPARAIRRADDS